MLKLNEKMMTVKIDVGDEDYSEIEYEEVVYDEPNVILERIKNREKEINYRIEELERMIEG